MKETIISFKTAQLANKKGFNINTGYLDYMMDGNFVGEIGCCVSCTSYIKCSTQSLLQKWLREIHKIDIEINAYQDDEGKTYYDYIIYSSLYESETDYKDGPFYIYEDALEVALEKALELINI